MAQRTPLYDRHLARGGRLVDFGGWELPVQYTTIVEEHTAVRTHAGMFDVSHMGRLSLGGPDALDLIQHVFTNDAAAQREFQVRYGFICNEHGGILDDVLVYKWPYGYAVVVNAANAAKISAWLAEHKGQRQVEVIDQTATTCMIALQGPAAVGMAKGLVAADIAELKYYHAAATRYQEKPCVVSRTGYTGEDGLEIIVGASQAVQLWDDLLARGAKPCGLGARDTLRLEAAMPLYGHELTEQIDPFQAGLAWAVKLDKGDFVGRAALQQVRQDATLPRRVGLELAGKRIAREGSAVSVSGKQIGRISSGTFAPTLQKAIAMAYIDRAFFGVGTKVEVDVRGKSEAARVVPLPFYRRN